MNMYAVIPLIATIVYIPLLIATISNRPWQRRHKLFLLFLVPAILYSFTDIFFRSNFFSQYNLLLLQIILILFAVMAVQLHCFTSSFFAPGQRRWLPFAYVSLAGIIALVALGYVIEGVTVVGDKLYADYDIGISFLALTLLVLATRNLYLFWRRLKILDSPVLYSQIVSLMLGVIVLVIFALAALLPWGREFAVTHLGSIIIASILSYATIRHQLLDIRMVLRRGLAWVSLGIIGMISYLLLLAVLDATFRLEFDFATAFVATFVAVLVSVLIYNLRGYFFATMGKAFQGQRYHHRRELSAFAGKIHNIFSLEEQGEELLALVTKAIGCREACLLLPEAGSDNFTGRFTRPSRKGKSLGRLALFGQSPVVEYLRREQRLLTREDLAILPEFRGLWEQEKDEIQSSGVELLMPLISRERLIGIMALDNKHSGRYSLEDLHLLGDVADQVAVSIEKEYLREQLREREEELSVINRSSSILTSSLDIQRIYDSFIEELKKVVDVSWTAIVLVEESSLYFLALSSEIGSAWKVGERMLLKGTAVEWVTTQKETLVEPDLTQESRFFTGTYHLQQGVRSIAYLPLIAKGEAIGSLIVASRHPNAYGQRHIGLLEQLASQIAMPIENSRLYAEAEQKARFDELTGLLNRRSLDELIASEIDRHSRYGGVLSLIILDLDSFKAFNDSRGHPAGDRLLRQVGDIMKKTIRSADQAFRYGGDEFAILLPSTTIAAAKQVAERVRRRVSSEVEAGSLPVTASLGLANWPADGMGANEVIAAADTALYRAKWGGGNQSRCASGVLPPSEGMTVGPEGTQDIEALSAIYSLAAAIDAKDHYTRRHSKRVSELAVVLAEALKLEPPEISKLETCALLHDIGKVGLSEKILNKRGKLTAEEREAIKAHPNTGANIASHVRQLAPYLAGIRYHHEKYDGSGYPEGLKGEGIPLEARILAIADAFAAMTSVRSYSDALPLEKALAEIKRGAGRQFDPYLVEVFLPVIAQHRFMSEEEKVRR